MKKNKYETYYWNLREKDESEKLRWALSQWRLLALHNMKGKNMGDSLPDIGTDEMGSSASFDLWMILQGETKSLLRLVDNPK